MKRIPVAGPSITDREVEYAADAARNGWYSSANVYPARLEQAFAAHCKRRHAVSLPSCTSGLHLALAALGVGPGDEVLVPEATWIASVAPVKYVGAKPVFVDVSPADWCIDVDAVAAAITPATRAVIAVDLYGSMPDYGRLERLLEERGIALIEDAAESIGSVYAARPAGNFGRVSVFSFHGSKTVTAGEGGMLVCDDDALFGRIAYLRDHGREPGDVSFRNTSVAYKYKMSPVQAALALAQLERVDELVAMKRQLLAWYRDELDGMLELNPQPPEQHACPWMITALLPRGTGGKWPLIDFLRERGVDSRPFFDPLTDIPAFAEHGGAERWRAVHPVAYDLGARGINLPSALVLTRDDVATVGALVREYLSAPAPVRS